MRWLFAGLSFALLVGLAVATVAVRASNVAARARLHLVEQGVVMLSVESSRRRQLAHYALSPVELRTRWRSCVDAHRH